MTDAKPIDAGDTVTDDYAEVLDTVFSICRTFAMLSQQVTDEEIKMALDAIECADSIGFVIDPTMYRAALQDRRLEKARAIFRAFRAFRSCLKEVDALGEQP